MTIAPLYEASLLRCPTCASRLPAVLRNGGGEQVLRCSCGLSYSVRGGVPRFVDSEDYVASFGIEWNTFPRTQLDSANGTQISRYRFEQLAGIRPSDLAGKRVLEVGCGMGRFLDVLAAAGAEVWGVDLSLAVDAAAENLRQYANCRVVQADLFNMPFGQDFDFIYSFGVLHHTPDPRAAFLAISKHLKPGGRIAAWVYGRGVSSGIKTPLVPRPYQFYGSFIKRLPLPVRKRALAYYTHAALAVGSIPLLGKGLKYILPIQDLRQRKPYQDGYEPTDANAEEREHLRLEWAMHSAFDMFTPVYTAQHDADEIIAWARRAGLSDINIGSIPVTVWAERPAGPLTDAAHVKKSKGRDKLHILFFVSGLGSGGAEMHLLRVINHLDRNRFRLSLALARAGGSYESNLAQDVQLYQLNHTRLNSSTLRMINSVRPLRKLIKAIKPDVIFSVMDHANVVSILASRGVPNRPKLVLNIQNPPKRLYGDSWNLLKRLMLLVIPRFYPSADRIIALSKGVAEEIVNLAPSVKGLTEVIHNAGLDEKTLSRRVEPFERSEWPSSGFVLVSCGRLSKEKGFSYLLGAMVRVCRETDARLLIMGEGPLRQELEKEIQQLGLQRCVSLLGFRENPFKFMAAADLFILPSLWEGFGNVLTEAMACGTPIVATNCPYGPREIIEDEVNGILVPPADPGALAEAIIRVLRDNGLRQRLSNKGRRRAEDFSAPVIAKAFEKMLLNVANGVEKDDLAGIGAQDR